MDNAVTERKPHTYQVSPGVRNAMALAESVYAPVVRLKMVCDRGPGEMPKITTPKDAYAVLKPYFAGAAQEHMVVLALNTRNRVLGLFPVYVGSVHTTVIRLAELFRPAVLFGATAMVLAHNHPSGETDPSPEDIELTAEVEKVGTMLDIDLLDHLVISDWGFTSLRELDSRFSPQ